MYISRSVLSVALSAAILSFTPSAFADITFKKGETQKLTGVTCGLVKNRWVAVKKSGKKYALDVKNKDKKLCTALLAPGNLRKRGLSALPSTSALVSLNAKAKSTSLNVSAVSGTPPLLKEIPNMTKETFWRPGVVEAINARTATSEQCNEFFGGSVDGQSSGMLGCYLSQGVGESFENVLKGGSSLCYMKNFPTKANVKAGAVIINKGKMPGGEIESLFAVPAGASKRLIKVNVTGDENSSSEGDDSEIVFIQPDNEVANEKNGNQYGYKLWMCDTKSKVTSVERATVSLAGKFQRVSTEVEGSNTYRSAIAAFLTAINGKPAFDASKERTAAVQADRGTNGAFKSEVVVTAENLLLTKSFEHTADNDSKSYSAATFTGSGVSEFRFLDGAYHQIYSISGQTPMTSEGAIEYRDTLYSTAASSSLLANVDAVDLASDDFYQSVPSTSLDTSGVSCAPDTDIEVSLDFSNPTLHEAIESCDGERLDGMDFCGSNVEVNNAQQNYQQACFHP